MRSSTRAQTAVLSVFIGASILSGGCARHRVPELAIGPPGLDVASSPPRVGVDRSSTDSRARASVAPAATAQVPSAGAPSSQSPGTARPGESVGTSGSKAPAGASGSSGSVVVTTVPNPSASDGTSESAALLGQRDRPRRSSVALLGTVAATAIALGSIAWYRRRHGVRS
jgi:hypothetical protein